MTKPEKALCFLAAFFLFWELFFGVLMIASHYIPEISQYHPLFFGMMLAMTVCNVIPVVGVVIIAITKLNK
jgi:hypothetical protein